MATAPAVAPTTSAARATDWQMWVPCIGMALCSWLSFVDRQVLNILAPTIIKDTGLTNQDFTAATSFFFLTYTLGNPVWGTVIDYIGLESYSFCAGIAGVELWEVNHGSTSGIATFSMVLPLAGSTTSSWVSSSLTNRSPESIASTTTWARPSATLAVRS